jgi:hypothetical protein
VPILLWVCARSFEELESVSRLLTESWHRDFEKLLAVVTAEQKKDNVYLKRFLKSPSIRDHIAGFKQKLEDARWNLSVMIKFYALC